MIKTVFDQNAEQREKAGCHAFMQHLARLRPDLEGRMMLAAYGRNAHVVMTEDEVFKAPKRDNPQTADWFLRERKVMECLQGRNMPVPAMTFATDEPLCYGMTRVQGAHLHGHDLGRMDKEKQAEIAHACAAFHDGLHEAFSGDLRHVPPSIRDLSWAAFDVGNMLREEKSLQGVFKRGRYDYLLPLLMDYCDRLGQRPLRVMHVDLHGENIVVDPESGRVKAFLDMGGVMAAHPEYALGAGNISDAMPYLSKCVADAWYDRHPEEDRRNLPLMRLAIGLHALASPRSQAERRDMAYLGKVYEMLIRTGGPGRRGRTQAKNGQPRAFTKVAAYVKIARVFKNTGIQHVLFRFASPWRERLEQRKPLYGLYRR